jgi:hypothetical protein
MQMNTHKVPFGFVLLGALGSIGTLGAPAAQAAMQPFSGSFQGGAQVVEVVDPATPVLRFQTQASGAGSFGLVAYASEDIVNMATGVGSGSHVFTAGNGDELFGQFTVQVVPTATPGTVDLFGQTRFTGGTGLFAQATGAADFTGSAVFTSETTALSTLNYGGSIALVPEPGGLSLMALGLAALSPWLRRRGRSPLPVASAA